MDDTAKRTAYGILQGGPLGWVVTIRTPDQKVGSDMMYVRKEQTARTIADALIADQS